MPDRKVPPKRIFCMQAHKKRLCEEVPVNIPICFEVPLAAKNIEVSPQCRSLMSFVWSSTREFLPSLETTWDSFPGV
jgi:hypothetical protein